MTNGELVKRLKELVHWQAQANAEVVRLIAEVDARQCYRQEACSSTFAFCTQRLGLSEDAAYKRIQVARLGRRIPAVLGALSQNRIHLSGLTVLAAHLTEENAAEVLDRAAHKTKREIEVLIAELAPKPDVAPSIRKAPVRREKRLAPAPPGLPVLAKPLAPERYHIHFTAGPELKADLDAARELTGKPIDELIAQGVALLLAKLRKDRFGTGRPGTSDPQGRYIPKPVRRAVYERDQGQCTFVDRHGNRCAERLALHYDHIIPFAKAGGSTADNLRLRCGPHNQLAAEEHFGAGFMAAKRTSR